MSQHESEGVLSRWSRRKLQTADETSKEDLLIAKDPENSDNELLANDQSAEAPVEPVLTDEDMPSIDSLGAESDFSGFMSPGVSDKLRNMALRKMFKAPSFNITDGLDEYDEDYTQFEKLGDIVTCDMKHQIEMQEKKKLEEAEALADEKSAGVDEQAVDPEDAVTDQEAQLGDNDLVDQELDENGEIPDNDIAQLPERNQSRSYDSVE